MTAAIGAILGAGTVFAAHQWGNWIVALLLVPFLAGLVAMRLAKQSLRTNITNHPAKAVRLFRLGLLTPFAVAVFSGAAVIAAAVWLAPPDGGGGTTAVQVDPYLKEGLKAVSGAVAALLTGWFLSQSGPSMWVASRVKSAFKATFTYVPADLGKSAYSALYDDTFEGGGWSGAVLAQRATVISEAIASGVVNIT